MSRKPISFDILMEPEKYGYKICNHCHGYGSSFKDPEGVDTCSVCGGNGVVKKGSQDEFRFSS